MRERLRRPINEQRLFSAVEGIASTSSIAWRSLFQGMGYQVEQLPQRGYLLRHDNAPVGGVGLVHRRMAADCGAPQPGQPSLRGVAPRVGGRADTGMAGRCRWLSKDYEELPETGETWVHLAMVHLMLKRLKPT